MTTDDNEDTDAFGGVGANRFMTATDYYKILTPRGERYAQIGYWFATGWWFAQRRADWVTDHSSDFRDYCARRADEYANGQETHLPSIPDLWKEFHETLDD